MSTITRVQTTTDDALGFQNLQTLVYGSHSKGPVRMVVLGDGGSRERRWSFISSIFGPYSGNSILLNRIQAYTT